jgi:hypothetical protein
MFQGRLLAIYLTPRRGADLRSVEQAEAVAGRGLVGDRYFLPEGKNKPDVEVTLIEQEALQALAADYGLTLDAVRSRRNLLTEGAPLNHLVGKEFTAGAVVLRGLRLCEPCGHLEKLTMGGLIKGATAAACAPRSSAAARCTPAIALPLRVLELLPLSQRVGRCRIDAGFFLDPVHVGSRVLQLLLDVLVIVTMDVAPEHSPRERFALLLAPAGELGDQRGYFARIGTDTFQLQSVVGGDKPR